MTQHIIMYISGLSFRIFIIIEKNYALFGLQDKTAMIYIGKLHTQITFSISTNVQIIF